MYINTKIIFGLAATLLGFANLSYAMEPINTREHILPTLQFDYKCHRAIFKIAAPEEWRQGNSYLENKQAIEQAIIGEPQTSVKYSMERFNSIVIGPVENKKFNKKEVDEFFNAKQEKNIVGNHYAFMKECNELWCPLTRSIKNKNRTDFENNLVEQIKNQHDIKIPIRYIGFASGLNFFGDLRIIMMLKMAGFKFEKIQIIDPFVAPYIEYFIKPNTINQSYHWPLPMNGEALRSYFSDLTHFQSLMNTHLIAQFLAILSNYEGDEIVEYYLTVEDYLKDFEESSKAHMIVALDLLDPRAIVDQKASIVQSFDDLKKYNNGAIVGCLYADYLHKKPSASFKFQSKKYPYALCSDISIINLSKECAVCQKNENELLVCPCGHDFYCSKDCQKKDWPRHKSLFHQNK